jgi:hypothetical protein
MKKIIKLTESDLIRIVKRVISEQMGDGPSLFATPGGNFLLSGGKGKKTPEERTIYELKSLLMELTIYRKKIGDMEISSDEKESIKNYVDEFIDGQIEASLEDGIEDLSNIENVANMVRDQIYSMFSINTIRLK